MPAPHHSPLQIGEWRVDPSLDQITRDGRAVKLEPRAMGVLMCLAEHAGQVVTVDQLLNAVWKDVVVTPDSVYQAVAALRKALGDDTKAPAYIANVVRRGYRLVAPVAPVAPAVEPQAVHNQPCVSANSAASAESPVPLATSSPKARTRPRWSWIAPAIALFVGAGFLVGNFLGHYERQSG